MNKDKLDQVELFTMLTFLISLASMAISIAAYVRTL